MYSRFERAPRPCMLHRRGKEEGRDKGRKGGREGRERGTKIGTATVRGGMDADKVVDLYHVETMVVAVL